jgi:diguanylate cyclase (GGDEF)-like protein
VSAVRRDSFSTFRDTLRWRVALVLCGLVVVLMALLGAYNVRNGFPDAAWMCLAVGLVALACAGALLALPRRTGGTVFFATMVALLVVVMVFGLATGKPMQHWAYIMPPVAIFLLPARRALGAMLVYGVYAGAMIVPVVAGIDVVRFASGYSLLCCFMYTYALLQERAASMLRYHSDHDALTNCYNRRTFNEALEEIGAAGGPARCAFLLVDIDHFKAINDQHGHLVGDRIITQAAALLGRELGPGMPLFRYGGEEFAVMWRDADRAAAAELAERMRAAIQGADFQGVPVTVSIGVAEWAAGRGPVAAALARADAALYAAKRAGRNRVTVDEVASRAA